MRITIASHISDCFAPVVTIAWHIFVCAGAAGIPFVELLSKLFNHGALLLQQNASLVAEHFGAATGADTEAAMAVYGRSAGLVVLIRELHAQCDLLAADLVHQFVHKRGLRQLIEQQMARGALDLDEVYAIDGRNAGAPSDRRTGDVAPDVDLAAIDRLLDEMVLISQRSESFSRFMGRWAHNVRVAVDIEIGTGGPERGLATPPAGDAAHATRAPRILPNRSEFSHLVQEMTGMYTVLELAYMLQSMRKSVAIEEALPFGVAGVHVSSIVGDAFCIMQKSMSRAQATGNVDSACGVANHINVLLAERLHALLKRRASTCGETGRNGRPVQRGTHTQGSRSGPRRARAAAATAAAVDTLSVTLNSLQLASEYTRELQMQALRTANDVLQEEKDKSKFRSCCDSFGDVALMFDQALAAALDRFATSLFAKVRAFIDRNFVDYELSEAAYEESEASDTFASRVLRLKTDLGSATAGIHAKSANAVGERILAQTCERMKTTIARCSVTPLGALVLDRQLRALQQAFLDLHWPHLHLAGLRQMYCAYDDDVQQSR